MPIRPAEPRDLDTIIELVHALAEYEREPEAVQLDRAGFAAHLFGPRPYAEVLICETESGESAGFALFFHNFSTWTGKPGIWLEDLFVRPALRGHGYGKALLVELARIAVDRLLPLRRRHPNGRLDHLPCYWRSPEVAGRQSQS
jgi:GNAT superfamily N-acetyltransferase